MDELGLTPTVPTSYARPGGFIFLTGSKKMKLKTILVGAFALFISLNSVVYAGLNYYPPERINCELNYDGRVICYEFNRHYLVEDPSNNVLQLERNEAFHFVSATSYTTPDESANVVFFTYNNANNKTIKLKTIHWSITPDVKNGNWRKINEEIYVCDTGYMNCPITNLP